MQTLASLLKGQKAIIVKVDDTEYAVKLMEMGCLPEAVVEMIRTAPLGDPIAIMVAGYCLSMRKAEAASVWVTLL
jgi:ferrous iron transport protein A